MRTAQPSNPPPHPRPARLRRRERLAVGRKPFDKLRTSLAVGDRLRRSDGGMAKVLVVERVKLAEPEAVYNFTVKGPHTYFVLEVGVLVHNDTEKHRGSPVFLCVPSAIEIAMLLLRSTP